MRDAGEIDTLAGLTSGNLNQQVLSKRVHIDDVHARGGWWFSRTDGSFVARSSRGAKPRLAGLWWQRRAVTRLATIPWFSSAPLTQPCVSLQV